MGTRAVNAATRSRILEPERVRSIFSYDPVKGVVTRLAGLRAGVPITSHTEGGCRVLVDGVSVQCAHISWVLTYGRRPSGQVRYRDGDRLNLRLDNLYESDEVYFDSNFREAA